MAAVVLTQPEFYVQWYYQSKAKENESLYGILSEICYWREKQAFEIFHDELVFKFKLKGSPHSFQKIISVNLNENKTFLFLPEDHEDTL